MSKLNLIVFLIGLWAYSWGQPWQMSLTNLSAEKLLASYVQYPSISGQEEDAGLFMQEVCRQYGLHVQEMRGLDGSLNFAASLYPLSSGKPNIVFLNHIDVVPASDSANWNYPPFGINLDEGMVWGRGAFDNKGAAVMQLLAVKDYVAASKTVSLPYNVTFLSVSGEEIQKGGAQDIVQYHLDALNPHVIIGEGPPSLSGVVQSNPEKMVFGIATGHKRSHWLKLDLTVESSSHGSVTPLRYANKEMVRALNQLLQHKQKAIYTPENLQILKNLGKLEGGAMGFVLRHPKLFRPVIIPQLRKQPEIFSLFSNTITLTNISNPETAHNIIPASVTCLLDCRLLPQTDTADFMRILRKRLDLDDVDITLVMQTAQAPCSDSDHEVFAMLKEAVQEYFGEEVDVVPLLLPSVTDSGWFRAKGIDAYDIIPAKISRETLECVHGNNEHIPIDALYEGAAVYRIFLSKMLGVQPDKVVLP